MPKNIKIRDEVADALNATPEAAEHGRSYWADCLLSDALGLPRPETPTARRQAAGREFGPKGLEERWGGGEKKDG